MQTFDLIDTLFSLISALYIYISVSIYHIFFIQSSLCGHWLFPYLGYCEQYPISWLLWTISHILATVNNIPYLGYCEQYPISWLLWTISHILATVNNITYLGYCEQYPVSWLLWTCWCLFSFPVDNNSEMRLLNHEAFLFF